MIFFKVNNYKVTAVIIVMILLVMVSATGMSDSFVNNKDIDVDKYQQEQQQKLKQQHKHKQQTTQQSIYQHLDNNITLSDSLPSSLTLRLQSYSINDNFTYTKYIPPQKTSSCQLIVFVVYKNTFTIILQGIQGHNINYLYVEFMKLQLNSIEKVVNKKVQYVVKVNQQKILDGELTQYITIKGLATQISIYNTQVTHQGQKSQLQSQQSFTLQPVFQQTRKVYLLQYSQDQWPNVTLPIRAIIITQLLAFLLIILLSHNIKYRRFLPFNFGILFAILYSLALLIIVYIDEIVQLISSNTSVQNLQIPKYMVSLMALFAITLYIMDLLNFWLQSKTVMFIISIVLSMLLIIVDQFILQDYWYINDIIAILVSGCLIKFIVIRKMKTSIIPLGILWLFSILRQFIHVQSVAQQISLAIFPLHLQIPACLGDDQDGYSCSAFGSSKIIIIGLLVNYCVRVDLFISSRFYQILSLIIAFISLFIELVFSIIWDEIPVMEYFSIAIYLPITILVILAFAQKRGQWAIVWHGSFYDMAVNRTSIRKSQKQSISQIDSNFGQGLILSGSQAYTQGSMIQKKQNNKIKK